MRLELLYNPRVLIERLAIASQRSRRLAKLKNTVAKHLKLGHIDSLELLELTKNNPPQVIYDIGANVGTWALLAKALFPQSEIHCFEPLPMHHAEFHKNTDKIDHIYLHNVALGSNYATLKMQVASFSDASSLLEIDSATENCFGVTKSGEEDVLVVPLDDYRKKNQLPLPDLLKLDIQGYELEALKGGEECLSHAQFLIVEVSFLPFYKNQAFFHDIITYLASRNFYLIA